MLVDSRRELNGGRHQSAANLDEFKELIAEGIDKTRGEPGNLQYNWYFNDDETKCFVRETYANSNAVLAQMGNMGDTLGKMIEMGGGLEIEVFGNPSAELVEAAAALQPNMYPFYAGK